jgi:rfaE bifunctional protein nucleotidyltransferase chain/domain
MKPARTIAWGEISTLRHSLRSSRQSVVVTNGCFDLLHVGHLRYLTQAATLGSFLWVGINSDASVRALKGPNRPINTEADRAEILGGLRAVHAVSIFADIRATEFLRLVQPDIYVKGGDYTLETLDPDERAALETCGAKIQLLPLIPGKSTSSTIQRMSA